MKNASQKTNIIKLYIYNFIVNFAVVDIILNLYFRSIGLSFSQIGILLAVSQFGKLFFEIPTGYIADRYGNKKSVLTALLLQITAYSSMYLCVNYYFIILLLIILSISYTLTTGCVDAIIVDTVSKTNDRSTLVQINAINRIIQYFSFGLAGVTAGFLAEKNYALVFAVNVFLLVICFLVFISVDDSPAKENRKHSEEFKPKNIAGYIRSNRFILYFILIESAIAWAMIPIDGFYSNYLHSNFNIPISLVGLIIGLQYMLISFVGLYSRNMSKHISINKTIRIGPMIMIALFFLFSVTKAPLLSIIFYVLALGVFCLYNPVRYGALQNSIVSKYRVTVISFKSVACAGLSMISHPLMGCFSDALGMQVGMQILIGISFFLLILINCLFGDLNFNNTQP